MTATLLLQIAAKATLVLLGGFALTRAMSRASAAARHLIWVLTLTAALGVPAMHLAGPAWTLAVLPQTPAEQGSSLVIDAPVATTAAVLDGAKGTGRPIELAQPVDADQASAAIAPVTEPVATPLNWGEWLVRLWLVGVALMLARLFIGIAWASLTVRNSIDLPETGWLDSLDEAAATLGLTRRVGLRINERATVPMATGLVRPVVLLPPTAIDWPEERRRVVLQHELAHVKRHDCLMQALAQAVCAIHWFNPFAHVAVSGLRAEQEKACDDMVIAVGTDARSYADHLFEIALSFRTASFPTWVAMSMAKPSQLEGRVLAILDEARARYTPSAPLRALLIVATMIVAVPFGALRLAAQASPSGAASSETPVASDATAQHDGDAAFDRDSRNIDRIASHHDVFRAVSTDVVHGNIDDVDLLELEPSLSVADALQAGQFKEAGKAAAKAFKDATTWITFDDGKSVGVGVGVGRGTKMITVEMAGAQAAQGNSTVSDDTRRRVADALISALGDDNPQVRQEALTSLASMRDERAIPGLVRALADPTTEVRVRALSALGQFNTPAAVDGVLTALKDRSPQVREMAARQLSSLVSRGQFRDQKYIDALSALLKDENADVRGNAAIALGRMRVAGAAPSLIQALRDASPDVRSRAARALGFIESADAVTALIPLLKDSDKDVREQAANALGDIADPRAIDALTAALKDTDAGVREEVARALGQIARGQRRGVRPGVPVPPLPPLPPRVSIDQDRIREIEERAHEVAERAMLRMRDFDFRFELPGPLPVPEPSPAPPAPPAPPVAR